MEPGGVPRDMFGREITTHTRRFSSGADRNRGTPSRHRSGGANSTSNSSGSGSGNNRTGDISQDTPHANEESPLLPVFDLQSSDIRRATYSGSQSFQQEESLLEEERGEPVLGDNMVTKRFFYTSVTILVMLLMSINIYFFYSLRTLQAEGFQQHKEISELKRNLHTNTKILDKRLQTIENMTSNADVIDEMHHTELRLEDILHKEQKDVNRQVSLLQQNVSKSIYNNEHQVQKKLSTVDSKLSNTTSYIKRMLHESEKNVSREINAVSKELEAEEKTLEILHANVTRQVNQLSVYMNSSIIAVNSLVADAKKKIKAEVKEVYDSLDQYISTTTAQFAAENDFVKYQLAGSFSILACLICLYHVTSHVRKFERPDVQRRILAILWMVPIYSVTSWLQLVFPSSTNILSGIRDCYEAYVVYTFFAFLIAVLAHTNVQVTTAGNNISNVHNQVVKLLAKRISDQREAQAREDASSISSSPKLNASTSNDVSKHKIGHPITPPCSCFRHCFKCCSNTPSASSTSQSSINKSCCGSNCCTCVSVPRCCCLRNSTSPSDIESSSLSSGDDPNSPRNIAASVLYQCSFMTLQFVLLKPLLAAMPFFFWLAGVPYEEHQYYDIEDGSVDWTSPKLYVLMIANLSVSVAFYGLLSFYHTTEKDLAWCDPWPKFLCIKGVVFMTFWQYVVLQMMSGMGLVEPRAASQIQNLLICIEMFMASIAHFYVFPHEEWALNYEKEQKKIGLFRDTLALSDFVTDIGMMTRSKPYAWEGQDDEERMDAPQTSAGRRPSYGSLSETRKHGTRMPENIENWDSDTPSSTKVVHAMGPRKQSRDLKQMLQSPSLEVSTPLHLAAKDMKERLKSPIDTEREKTTSNDSEHCGDDSSEDSFSPHLPNTVTRFPDQSDMMSEQLDSLSPTLTPLSKPSKGVNSSSPPSKSPLRTDVSRKSTPPTYISPLGQGYTPEISQPETKSVASSNDTPITGTHFREGDSSNNVSQTENNDEDIDVYFGYSSPTQTVPMAINSKPTPYSSVTKTDTTTLNNLTPPNHPSPYQSLGGDISPIRGSDISVPDSANNSLSSSSFFSPGDSPNPNATVSSSSSSITQVASDRPRSDQSATTLLPSSFLRDFSEDSEHVADSNIKKEDKEVSSTSPPQSKSDAGDEKHGNVTLEDDSDSDCSVISV